MKTADRLFYDLCDEIDELKESIEYWKNKFNEERKRNDQMLADNLASAKQGVANALMFALSVKDDANGNLVIDKKDRKALADRYKS